MMEWSAWNLTSWPFRRATKGRTGAALLLSLAICLFSLRVRAIFFDDFPTGVVGRLRSPRARA